MGSLAAATASTVNGRATTTFTASNKSGAVTITASAGGGVVSNNTSVTIQPAAVGSIQFVSATPQLIGIRTATSTPSSIIKFLVNDVTGNPMMGATVNFTLNGPGGNEYIGTNDRTPTTDSAINSSGWYRIGHSSKWICCRPGDHNSISHGRDNNVVHIGNAGVHRRRHSFGISLESCNEPVQSRQGL